jgi:hypothetical protein
MDINQKIEIIDKIVFIIYHQLFRQTGYYFINGEKRAAILDLQPKKELILNNSVDLETRLQTIIEIADILFHLSGRTKLKVNFEYHRSIDVFNDCKRQYMEATDINERLQKIVVVVLVAHHVGLTAGFGKYFLSGDVRQSHPEIRQLFSEGGFIYPW